AELRDRAAGYEHGVLVDGARAPTYLHEGESYVLGQLGARYSRRVSNHTGRRVEAVVSVDGRDAVDGRPADPRGKRGYLVPAGAARRAASSLTSSHAATARSRRPQAPHRRLARSPKPPAGKVTPTRRPAARDPGWERSTARRSARPSMRSSSSARARVGQRWC